MTTRSVPPLRPIWFGLLALAVGSLSCSEDAESGGLDSFGTDGPGGSGPGAETSGSPGDGSDPTDGGSGADDSAGAEGYDCAREQAWYAEFAEDHCGRCHGATEPKGGFDHVVDVDKMLVSGKVVPGDPAASPVFLKMSTGAMPPAGEQPRPSEAAIERTAEMIRRCTLDSGPGADDCVDMQYVGYDAQLALMLDDLRALPAGDYPFIRYLTFTHLHNAGLCGPSFEAYRTGLAKLVNSLSDQNVITPPIAVDPNETIFRIDLRDYGWDVAVDGFADKWEAVADQHAYAVVRLENDAVTLQQLTLTQFPFLTADAFVQIASQPPLYPVMLGLPDTLAGLEAQLGLDIADDVGDQQGVARAGVLVSGVAIRNRVLQRHVIGNGAFWRTFEFDDDTAPQQNILTSPLDFQEEGGSIIFSLPNALHGYMVINRQGGRIDQAPVDLMLDPGSAGGRVLTGLSCFGCHTEVVSADDSVRDFVLSGADFDATEQATVSALYPPVDEFHDLQTVDTDAYHVALADAGVNPEAPEPITGSVFAFEESPITMAQAAAELGITPELLDSKIVILNPALEGLRDGGTIKRNTWQGVFADSICLLNLGTPRAGCP